MMKPFRLAVAVAGANLSLDFRAHEQDPDLVVCKAPHPEALDNLILVTGVDPEVKGTAKGSTYFITTMTKAGAAKLLAAVVTGLVTKEEAAKLNAEAAGSSGDDDNDDNDDN